MVVLEMLDYLNFAKTKSRLVVPSGITKEAKASFFCAYMSRSYGGWWQLGRILVAVGKSDNFLDAVVFDVTNQRSGMFGYGIDIRKYVIVTVRILQYVVITRTR